MKNSCHVPAGQKMYLTPNMLSSADTKDQAQQMSPPRRKVSRDEKIKNPERPRNVTFQAQTHCLQNKV